jgi:hypothetical protein
MDFVVKETVIESLFRFGPCVVFYGEWWSEFLRRTLELGFLAWICV